MMLVAPKARICSWASRLVPSAIASIEITAATPKTMPSTVSPDRSLCSSRLFIPSLRPRQMRPIGSSSVCQFFARAVRALARSSEFEAPVATAPSTDGRGPHRPRLLQLCIRGARASSMIRPSRIRMIRLAQAAMSSSWVTMMIVLPASLSRSSTSMISWLVVVSRLPVASSARMMYGSLISERAIATRCCWPPESCDGRWSSRSPRPTRVGHLDRSLLGLRADLAGALVGQRELDVLEDGVLLDQVVRLEDEAEVAAADLGELVVVEAGDVAAAQEVLAAGGAVEAAQQVEHGALARARRAHDGDVFAGVEVDRDAPQGVDGHGRHLRCGGRTSRRRPRVTHHVGLGHVDQLDDRLAGRAVQAASVLGLHCTITILPRRRPADRLQSDRRVHRRHQAAAARPPPPKPPPAAGIALSSARRSADTARSLPSVSPAFLQNLHLLLVAGGEELSHARLAGSWP